MLIIRGVNIFPRQIEELIVSEPLLSAHYRIDVRRAGARDELEITVELKAGADEDTSQLSCENLSHRIKSHYGITAQIRSVPRGKLPRSEGKAKRMFDHRKKPDA
jgi:phenylacetate-CoA ligase